MPGQTQIKKSYLNSTTPDRLISSFDELLLKDELAYLWRAEKADEVDKAVDYVLQALRLILDFCLHCWAVKVPMSPVDVFCLSLLTQAVEVGVLGIRECIADFELACQEYEQANAELLAYEQANCQPSPPPQSQGKLLEKNSIPGGQKTGKALGNPDCATLLQHFYYLLLEGYGKVADGERWLYNPRWVWVEKHFCSLSEWEYRKARDKLIEAGLLKTRKLRAKEWDHTNYHTLDYDRLKAFNLSIGEAPPIDWRLHTNRLETPHQSIKESEPAAKLPSSIKSASSSQPAFPPQTGKASTGATPCNGAPNVASLRANHCIEPPPPCSQNHSHGGGMLTVTPTVPIQPPVVDSEYSGADDDSSAATPPKSRENPYSRVQLETLKSLGIILNSAIMAQLRKVQPQQIDDAITCFQEDKQSWAKNKPMRNPSGFFTKVLKQVVNEGRSPLPKSDPLTEDLEIWQARWFNPMLVQSRSKMLADIQAKFTPEQIIVRDWDEGPIAGTGHIVRLKV